MTGKSSNVTALLLEWGKGDRQALDALVPLVYEELRRRAGSYMRSEKPGHSLQPTVLVHEAYLRLVDQDGINWQNRSHFFAVASQILRHILVDHARARHRLKRGGEAFRVTWVEDFGVQQREGIDLMALHDALERLSESDPQQGRIVELRFFGGLSIEETAEALNISSATVKREWSMARAWLYRELTSR
ncbi:MAG TPA: sigma-70 family RNA polymerase sigma factor [Terriglobia bacterium]|nr:sigma-70 family RNA polymerase sigma factor [Terriglobia bacterium]